MAQLHPAVEEVLGLVSISAHREGQALECNAITLGSDSPAECLLPGTFQLCYTAAPRPVLEAPVGLLHVLTNGRACDTQMVKF